MTYEAEVNKVYPNAKSHDDFREGDCFISTDNPVSILGDGNTEKEAWEDAYKQIQKRKQKTISPKQLAA